MIYSSFNNNPLGRIKINSDGSVLQVDSKAACGGILRDHLGNFVLGYYANLGSCTITFAELWGIYHGLSLVY